MTFALTPEHQAARERARAFARDRVAPAAEAIDRSARVPEALAAADGLLPPGADLLTVVVVTEELATASASAALAAAIGAHEPAKERLAGLSGAPTVDRGPRSQIALASAALGIARAALDRGLAELREGAAHPGGDEKPHWAVADVATEIDGARLLTCRAAMSPAGEARDVAIAMARLMASAAATRAVDVALRLGGAAAFAAGSGLDRLARDARAIALVAGSEEQLRGTAADGLFPA
jgi:alkylation response protein AidB-like acyl-CoA dehydrogenase